jgi:hypothetical protein
MIFMEIREYVSKFEQPTDRETPREYRFVAYTDSAPALMIEFFPTNFHIYGPRALRSEQVLGNLREAMRAAMFTARMGPPLVREADFFSAATMVCVAQDDEVNVWQLDQAPGKPGIRTDLADFESQFESIERMVHATTSYISMTIPMLGFAHWADLEGAPNPRSGFAFYRGCWEPRWYPEWSWWQHGFIEKLIAELTTAPVMQSDLSEIADFAMMQWRKRYV